MFQELINGSVAVLTKPSVSTFEEHEKNNLVWALIYSVLGALIGALISSLTGQLTTVDPETGETIRIGFLAAFFTVMTFGILFLLISYGITYGLGRAFGGTGAFGELAYDMSLFGAPLGVASALLSAIPFAGGFLAFALWLYSLFLTYLAIQSGMNLPSNKAVYVILLQFLIVLALLACLAFAFAALIALAIGASGGFAP